MPRGKKFTAEQIIGKLREAEVGLAQGKTVPEVVRKLGVTEQTYYRWKREYGGLRTDQAKRLKDLEKENARQLGRAWPRPQVHAAGGQWRRRTHTV
jgi:putative transposase